MRFYRTIMTITRIEKEFIFAISGQWDPHQEFSFAKSILPLPILRETKIGDLLIADMNLESESKEDLQLKNFELPDPEILREI